MTEKSNKGDKKPKPTKRDYKTQPTFVVKRPPTTKKVWF